MELTPHHYGLTVSSIDDVVPFYRDTLGLEEVASGRFEQGSENSEKIGELADVPAPEFEFVLLQTGDIHIQLVEIGDSAGQAGDGANPLAVGEAHICFSVPDLEDTLAELGEEVDMVGSKAQFHDGSNVVYLNDPEENVVELIEWGEGL